MIIASLQPEVVNVVAWSAKMTHPSAKRPSSAWTVQKWPGNPTSPLTENECLANRCPVAPTSSGLWEARPGDGTLRSVVRSTSRYCVACLRMQPQTGHLGCQPPAANMREHSWRRPEPSLASSALPQPKQSWRRPSYPLFQRVSKPSPFERLTSRPIFNQWMIIIKPMQTAPEKERLVQHKYCPS